MFNGYGQSIISPCISECRLNEDDICTGCYRTASEITEWRHKSEDEQIRISIRCKKKIAEQTQSN